MFITAAQPPQGSGLTFLPIKNPINWSSVFIGIIDSLPFPSLSPPYHLISFSATKAEGDRIESFEAKILTAPEMSAAAILAAT